MSLKRALPPAHPSRVLAIGNTIIDTVLTMAQVPVDDKVWVDSKKRFVGGQGANAAQNMALLGLDVSFVTRLGGDDDGGWARQRFESLGLDTRHCIVVQDALTMSACVTIGTEDMSRSCLMHRDPKMFEASIEDTLKAVDLSDFDAVYTDGFQLDLAMPLVRAAAQRGLPIIADVEVVDEETRALAALATDLIAPAASVCELAESDDPEEAVMTMASRLGSGRRVIATAGERGSFGAQHGSQDAAVFVPAWKCNAQDTVGAGDAYHAGYVHALLSQGCRDLPECMAFATRVAAALVETPGPTVTTEALERWKIV